MGGSMILHRERLKPPLDLIRRVPKVFPIPGGGATSSVQGGHVEGAPTHKLKAEPCS